MRVMSNDFLRGRVLACGVAAMAVILVASNYLVQFPLGVWFGFVDGGQHPSEIPQFPLADWITFGAFVYPFSFLVTDSVNRWGSAALARRVVLFGFVFGVPLSFAFNFWTAEEGAWVNAVRISIASGLAFALGQLLDVYLFDRFRHRAQWWLPPLVSSAPSAVIDTLLFFAMAFVATGVPWLQLAVGDLGVKMLMVPLLLLPYRLLMHWLLPKA